MSSQEDLQNWFRQYRQVPRLLEQERWSEALEQIEALHNSLPPLPTGAVWSGLGTALRESLRTQKSCEWHYDPRFNLAAWQAQCLFQQGHKHEALEILRTASAQLPPQAPLLHQLSRYLLALGQTDQAIMALNQAIQTDPAYLSAFEDLAFLANEARAPDTAFQLTRLGLSQGFSLRLLEESLIAASQLDTEHFQKAFLELCIQSINVESVPLLLMLCQELYQRQDFSACEWLSWHLLAHCPEQTEILDLHLLAAWQLGHHAPVLSLLKTRLQADPEHTDDWYRLAQGYTRWQMPDFARHILKRLAEQAQTETQQTRIAALLATLPVESDPADALGSLIKEACLDPIFLEQLRTDPQTTTGALGMHWSEVLARGLQSFLDGLYNKASESGG
jgi:tetratricopeptide (TPR) repeat protein